MVPLDITNIDDTILNNTNKNLYNDGEARQGKLFKDITKLYEEDKSDVMLNERSRYEDRKEDVQMEGGKEDNISENNPILHNTNSNSDKLVKERKSVLTFWSTVLAAFIIVVLFLHPNIFEMNMEMFNCSEINGVNRLSKDLATE